MSAGRIAASAGVRSCGIDHHAQRLAADVEVAHVHARIVGEHGAAAGEDGAGARAQLLHVGARGLAGDPLRGAVGERGLAVQRRRGLQPHPRALPRHARDEAGVERARLGLHQADPRPRCRPASAWNAAAATSGLGSLIAATTRPTPA
jgi:hypothetical protein